MAFKISILIRLPVEEFPILALNYLEDHFKVDLILFRQGKYCMKDYIDRLTSNIKSFFRSFQTKNFLLYSKLFTKFSENFKVHP